MFRSLLVVLVWTFSCGSLGVLGLIMKRETAGTSRWVYIAFCRMVREGLRLTSWWVSVFASTCNHSGFRHLDVSEWELCVIWIEGKDDLKRRSNDLLVFVKILESGGRSCSADLMNWICVQRLKA
jgi:hypothetical protein